MNRKRVETDDAVAIDVEAKNIFRALVESISTSSTEYWYKLVGAGPECLSTFLNFQNSIDWLEVLSLIGMYNKEPSARALQTSAWHQRGKNLDGQLWGAV
jgi:hypothetical protein